MSKIENILEVSKKIISINYTLLEALQITKDEKVTDYITKLSNCHEKNSNDDSLFFHCTIKSICPEQTENFYYCQKENKNKISHCNSFVLALDDCMKSNSDRILEIFKKAKNY